MALTLTALAEATGLTLISDGSVTVSAAREHGSAASGDLALAMDPKYAEALSTSSVRAAVVWPDADIAALGLDGALVAPRARVALAGITAAFRHPPDTPDGIHPTAVVDPAARLGSGVAVGPLAVIGAGAEIGDGSRIGAHVVVGPNARIGDHALIGSGVSIGARVRIGARFQAQPGAVIGADGFSFVTPERSAVEAARAGKSTDAAVKADLLLRIHSLAAVEIGDDVEIGANSTVDRGTIAPTRIGSGTKIDNLLQVGHNVRIGQTCLICAHVGLAGSVSVGDRVVLGGKVGVGDHIEIGSDAVLAGGSLVGGNVPAGAIYLGAPAAPRDAAIAQIMAIKRLPRIVRQVGAIRDKLGL